MGRLPKHYPSFFKVLSNHDFPIKLRIPPAFVANFRGEFPASAVIRSRTHNDESWGVKIEQIGGTHWFMHDGWQNLVKDNRLELADFLVFRLISDWVFEVVIYAPTGCEKKPNPVRKSDPEQSIQDTFVAGPTRSPKSEDDSPHCSRRSRRGVVEAARSRRQKNPSYVVVLKNYHRSSMYFPKAFAEETGLARMKSVILRNNGGQLWPFETRPRPGGGVAIIAGWSAFKKMSNISFGDTCLFEFIRSAGNIIHVKVIKGEIKN